MRSIVIHLSFHGGNNLTQWTAHEEAATDLGVRPGGGGNE